MPATKTHSPRRLKAAAQPKPKTHPAKSFIRKTTSIEQNISHLRMNIMATVPGILDTDKQFRFLIIRYLRDLYRKELAAALEQGGK